MGFKLLCVSRLLAKKFLFYKKTGVIGQYRIKTNDTPQIKKEPTGIIFPKKSIAQSWAILFSHFFRLVFTSFLLFFYIHFFFAFFCIFHFKMSPVVHNNHHNNTITYYNNNFHHQGKND
jgi:hypothetical protein